MQPVDICTFLKVGVFLKLLVQSTISYLISTLPLCLLTMLSGNSVKNLLKFGLRNFRLKCSKMVKRSRGCSESTLIFGSLILLACIYGIWYVSATPKDDTIELSATQEVCTGISISEPPNMLIFQNIDNIFERISTNWEAVGTALLKDNTGDKMEIIDNDEKKTENKNRRVLRRWLKGEGRQPTTWSTLIDVLNEMNLKVLAEDIGIQVSSHACNMPSLPYAYSEEILGVISKLKTRYRSQRIVQFDLLEKFHTTNLPFLDVILRDHDEHGTSTSDKILHNVLNDATLHKRLLITGPPGSGKTTLVRYIAKKWAKGENLESCQTLFVIYLDKIKAENIVSLSDLLREQYKDIMDVSVVSKEIYSKSGNGTCLLLDAFDEKDIKTDYIKDLMFNNELPNLICILTSRPDSDLKATKASVDILGFKPNKLDSHLETLAIDTTVKRTVQKIW